MIQKKEIRNKAFIDLSAASPQGLCRPCPTSELLASQAYTAQMKSAWWQEGSANIINTLCTLGGSKVSHIQQTQKLAYCLLWKILMIEKCVYNILYSNQHSDKTII